MIKSYRDLTVWQQGIELAKIVYTVTKRLPKEELYGLASQMRRASISIPSNIAEGHQRQYQKEFRQFLYHSLGSLAELETQSLILNEVYSIDITDDVWSKMDLLGKKLRRLIKTLKIPATSD